MIGPMRFETFRCGPCEYHQERMVCSGPNPLYEYSCTHPGVKKSTEKRLYGVGVRIGYSDKTPDWCPERNNPRIGSDFDDFLKGEGILKDKHNGSDGIEIGNARGNEFSGFSIDEGHRKAGQKRGKTT